MTDHPECITKALAALDTSRAKIMALSGPAQLAESIKAQFAAEFPSLRTDIGIGALQLNGVLLFVDVDDFRKLVPIRRALRAAGLPAPEVSDYPEMKRRTWKYGDIILGAFLPYGEGAACEYVQVGTEEKPVFELRCGEQKYVEGEVAA